VKKVISIGVALALLTMAVVPGAVAAQDEPDAYSKIPFAILGTGIGLAGDILDAMGDVIALPFPVSNITALVGPWTMNEFSWLTELTAWTMVTVGDVMAQAAGLLTAFGVDESVLPISDVAAMFYVIGNRMFDAWGSIPTGNMTDQLPPALGLE
jgi:hypothetical protein